ncbi:type IV toxin-antitoxin system AbiEi family antitoxin domain-containing protein [Fusobacterium sp. HC1336]|uniref:type IV toxin-antitoxin system AbiEi family antitoxin domain-containing protein n=1 Tax=Fusobacterium sp. HC1336 TaxID=3171169 RepID=UPI003F28B257
MNRANIENILFNQGNGILNTRELDTTSSKYSTFKVLERMVKKGELKRAEKGLYYIPKKSIFGELPLTIKDFIQKYLYLGDKRIGYITGINLFNRYGLTTQLSNSIEIATNTRKNPREFDGIKIKFIQNKALITEENIKYLEILDILKNLKNIPDSNIEESYMLMKSKILSLAYEEILTLLELAEKYYTVVVLALLGSMIEEKNILKVEELKKKLNKTTTFKLNLNLKNGKEWRIS